MKKKKKWIEDKNYDKTGVVSGIDYNPATVLTEVKAF